MAAAARERGQPLDQARARAADGHPGVQVVGAHRRRGKPGDVVRRIQRAEQHLALHVVERYFGRPVAERTAAYMEYQSKGWMV